MMTESQALETLTQEDPEAAGDAKAALAWLSGDEGLETISLLRLQEFLWYALPVKWPMSTPGRVGVAKALGRLFTLAGLERYAGSMFLDRNREDHYRLRGRARGRYRGLHRGHRGVERGAARHRTAGLGVGDGGAGTRGLRRLRGRPGTGLRLGRAERRRARLAHQAGGHRQPLADRAVFPGGTTPLARPRLAGISPDLPDPSDGALGTDTWLGRISAERIDAWAHGRPGERSRLARGLIPRLLEPPALPDDPLPTLRWLLGHADEGLRLTARHYIAPALVTEAVDTFGWRDQLVGTLRQELDVFPLHTLRGMAQSEMGAIRRSRTSLVLTKTGKLMTADPAARWHIGTAALIGPDDGPQPDFSAAVREAALMVILTSGPTGYDELTRLLTDIHGVEGWASAGSTGLASAVRTELYTLQAPAVGAAPARRRAQFHRAALAHRHRGAAALSALLARALRPRHHLGPG